LSHIRTFNLRPGIPEIALCARWRIQAFSGVIGARLDDEIASLERFVADQREQTALMAERSGSLAGTCLLVPSEIEPVHNVSPWLAGLFVAPEHRRHGVGAALVRAIEEEARARDHQHLDWTIQDRVDWLGYPTVLMAREL
jgi:GNAT superfamily N-acetyltransferase